MFDIRNSTDKSVVFIDLDLVRGFHPRLPYLVATPPPGVGSCDRATPPRGVWAPVIRGFHPRLLYLVATPPPGVGSCDPATPLRSVGSCDPCHGYYIWGLRHPE